jgi:hypothetical protein
VLKSGEDIVRCLLAHNARTDIVDAQGKKPFDDASPNMKKMLESDDAFSISSFGATGFNN